MEIESGLVWTEEHGEVDLACFDLFPIGTPVSWRDRWFVYGGGIMIERWHCNLEDKEKWIRGELR